MFDYYIFELQCPTENKIIQKFFGNTVHCMIAIYGHQWCEELRIKFDTGWTRALHFKRGLNRKRTASLLDS